MGRPLKGRWLATRIRPLMLATGGVVVVGLLICRIWVGNGSEMRGPQPLDAIGAVVDVGERSATVNLGKRDGIEKGTVLEVFRPTVVETDTATGQPAVVRVEKIAEMKVVDADETGAEAIPTAQGAETLPIQVGDEVSLKGDAE